jgi:cytochrome c
MVDIVISIENGGVQVMRTKLAVLGFAGLAALVVSGSASAIDDAKAAELMKSGGCSTCHAVDKKVVGPAYQEVSSKHKGDADALAKMEKSVRAGSKEQYGKIPMPPTAAAKIGDADLHELLSWILTK